MAQRSAQTLPADLERDILASLFAVLADLEDEEEVKDFALSFFSEAELSIFAKRLAIAHSLANKRTYDQITNGLKVSTATVSNVAEQLHSPGYQLALQKMKVHSWARRLSNKLLRVFKTLE